MSAYSIRDLERLSGIKAPTIRMWEKRYKVITPKRTPTNIRYYDDEALRKVINLAILTRNGNRISDVATLDECELKKRALEYSLSTEDQKDQLQSLTLAMIHVDEGEFERTFERIEKEYGFEETILDFILPFLRNVGALWHSGCIGPAQEHFVSQLIRRKLMSAIEMCPIPPQDRSPRYLMFLPEGELHEIGLLFCHYLARKAGERSCYLGASVPMEDLRKLSAQYHYPTLLTAYINPIDKEELEKRIDTILELFPESELLATGPQVMDGLSVQNDRLHVMKSVDAFRDHLKEEKRIETPS